MAALLRRAYLFRQSLYPGRNRHWLVWRNYTHRRSLLSLRLGIVGVDGFTPTKNLLTWCSTPAWTKSAIGSRNRNRIRRLVVTDFSSEGFGHKPERDHRGTANDASRDLHNNFGSVFRRDLVAEPQFDIFVPPLGGHLMVRGIIFYVGADLLKDPSQRDHGHSFDRHRLSAFKCHLLLIDKYRYWQARLRLGLIRCCATDNRNDNEECRFQDDLHECAFEEIP